MVFFFKLHSEFVPYLPRVALSIDTCPSSLEMNSKTLKGNNFAGSHLEMAKYEKEGFLLHSHLRGNREGAALERKRKQARI